MNRRIFLQIIALSIFTVLVSGSLVYWSAVLNQSISSFHQSWQSDSEVSIKRAALLAELERSFGYNGFIHHFKNYILRQQNGYYDTALLDVESTNNAIVKLRGLGLTEQEDAALDAIQSTLDNYTHMLAVAKSTTTSSNITPTMMDSLVKVDDADAEAAFNFLRHSIGAQFSFAKQQQATMFAQTQALASYGTLLFIPIMLLFACLNIATLIYILKLLKEKRRLFNATPDAILYFDRHNKLKDVNQACTKLFGYKHHELLGMRVGDLIPQHRFAEEECDQAGAGDPQLKGKKMLALHQSGSKLPVDVAISTVSVSKGDVYIAVIRDLRQEQELRSRAELDFLTQVKNRRKIEVVLREEVQRAIRYHRSLSLLVVDIDYFKQLNDSAGHQDGDTALKEVGQFLTEQARPSDHIGRWGGDEFVIICPETAPDAALNFADRLVHDFPRFSSYGLTFSIGVAGYELIGESFNHQRCFEEADMALYQSKKAGRNQATLYIAPCSSFDKKA
ncbi:sensor domain-containing diguanylate cyclase [Pseudoalteromonas sp. J010]|uniref:sensor domain-containing diguanylate cyclase n=1 Tax=Pseudoalteromonas sp. J010 TaxID=998465 RepID=UPI000F6521CD|nr:sensor domain-containing diguanylate cyclase [Pseudoalteromonas sp. J010]RRS08217.1 sensor domain-containing diguanylate cyclase [Pseudoalteromonas sp. J010]